MVFGKSYIVDFIVFLQLIQVLKVELILTSKADNLYALKMIYICHFSQWLLSF